MEYAWSTVLKVIIEMELNVRSVKMDAICVFQKLNVLYVVMDIL